MIRSATLIPRLRLERPRGVPGCWRRARSTLPRVLEAFLGTTGIGHPDKVPVLARLLSTHTRQLNAQEFHLRI